MPARHDRALDILSEILATPSADRQRRLGKLPKPMLVRLIALVLQDWEREKTELRRGTDRLGKLQHANETPASVE